MDIRVTPPNWLTKEFRDTGDEIGLDGGPFQTVGIDWHNKGPSGVGPGVSIDARMSVWVKKVASPGVVELGPMAETVVCGANMYGNSGHTAGHALGFGVYSVSAALAIAAYF